jgi:hypothetical protein
MGSRTLEVEVSSIHKLDILAVQTGDLDDSNGLLQLMAVSETVP